MDTEANRVLAALKGQQQTETGHNGELLGSLSQLDRDDSMADKQAKPQVWTVPASVGSDLTRPMILNEIIAQWATLEDTQKINTLLGIAHVGQNRMQQVTGEVRRIAQLAKEDASSDWVRTLGALIGEVGTSGRMKQLNELDEPTRSEMEAAVSQIAAALEKSSLCLATPELSYLSSAVAKSIAPASICDIYGSAPKPKLLDRLMAQAKKKSADMRSPPTSRRPSAAPSLANRGSTTERDTSASSSRLGSPDPSGAGAFSDLFGDAADDGSDDDSCKSMESDSLPFTNSYRLPMNVKESHCADHVGRLSRLLAAAESVATTGDRHIAGDAHGMRPGRGGHAGAPGLGIRRGGSAGGGTSKLGMIAPRRRTNASAALPGGGLGAATSSRRADSSTPITHTPKKIRMAGLDEVTKSMGERERAIREEREKAAEEREAKKQKQQAEAEERKRRREEARQRKQAEAAAAPKRARRRSSKNVAGGSDDDGPGRGSKTPVEVRSPRPDDSSDDEFDIPLEYRMFTGDTPDRQALYTNTNALTDANRKLMYCFFKGLAMPPGTGNELKFVLNEAVIDDPRYPDKKCTELMLFKANLINGKWDKIRRLKR
ncbi:hypothetical protein LPJ79_004127 [Coemansia sp. RSA 1821]|nr:hypothetical protein LPJ79_004127 [Coemansia sp. RSA 1821]